MVLAADRKVDGPPPAHDEVRTFLLKLLASPDFNASARNKRFLTYVVDETLSGRGSRIKAYNIALAAFDRAEDFDPLVDPIVRIEAGRLRRSLEHYYLTAGKSDPIRIDMPKGSYVVRLSRVEVDPETSADGQADQVASEAPELSTAPISTSPAPPTTEAEILPTLAVLRTAVKRIAVLAAAALVVAIGTWIGVQHVWKVEGDITALPRGPRIIVHPFEEISHSPDQAFISRGMTYDIIASLTRFNDLFVYGPETSFYIGDSRGQQNTGNGVQADFALNGKVFSTNTTVRVSTVLADLKTGQSVWSWSHEWPLTPSNLRAAQTDIAEEVARVVAQPYGSIFERSAADIAGKPAADLLSYECVVRFQQYWRAYDVGMYDDLLECMTATIARDPGYARAYSSLALLYVDTYRFGYGTKNPAFDPIERALELAYTAIRLEPMASDGYLALSVARWFDHDVDGGLEAARQGLALNPNDTILIGELGIRYALLARWDESKPMLDKLFALNPRAPAGYRRGNFLYTYMHGDYQAALQQLLSAEMPLNIYDHVFRAMTYAQLGDSRSAREAVSQILAFDPKYGERVVSDFGKRNTDPSIVRAIVDGLAKAGLPVSPASKTN